MVSDGVNDGVSDGVSDNGAVARSRVMNGEHGKVTTTLRVTNVKYGARIPGHGSFALCGLGAYCRPTLFSKNFAIVIYIGYLEEVLDDPIVLYYDNYNSSTKNIASLDILIFPGIQKISY